VEQYFFKWKHKRYIAEYTPAPGRDNQWALWAIAVPDSRAFDKKDYFLGVVNNEELTRVPYEALQKYDWCVMKGAERLYSIITSKGVGTSIFRLEYRLDKVGRITYNRDMPKSKDIDSITEFVRFRKMGLTMRQVGKLMGKDLKTLARWNAYIRDGKVSVGQNEGQKLSTA